MYKEKTLLKKVKNHINDDDKSLLDALISDINDFNKSHAKEPWELYIDYEDDGGDWDEYTLYETFSINLYWKKGLNKSDTNIHDGLTIGQLDDCLCAIEVFYDYITENN